MTPDERDQGMPDTAGRSRLAARGLTLGYDQRVVSTDLDLEVPQGQFTVIVGPNACGKSTLLKALARVHRPSAGSILLDGQEIRSLPTKEVARRVGLLAQSPTAPEGITVADLVARGRFPHQGFLRQWSAQDQQAVEEAMALTRVTEVAERPVDELSGGQRQRASIAMVVAQSTPLLLLDEPTTYLDLPHQLEVLNLCLDMIERGVTLVAVLHDLNLAYRYATHLVCMRDGRIVAQGAPAEIVDAALVREVFDMACTVIADPASGTPLIVPATREERRSLAEHR